MLAGCPRSWEAELRYLLLRPLEVLHDSRDKPFSRCIAGVHIVHITGSGAEPAHSAVLAGSVTISATDPVGAIAETATGASAATSTRQVSGSTAVAIGRSTSSR